MTDQPCPATFPDQGKVRLPVPVCGPRRVVTVRPSAPGWRISIWYSRVAPARPGAGGSGRSQRAGPLNPPIVPVTIVTAGGIATARSSVTFRGTISPAPPAALAAAFGSPAHSPETVTDRLSGPTATLRFFTPATAGLTGAASATVNPGRAWTVLVKLGCAPLPAGTGTATDSVRVCRATWLPVSVTFSTAVTLPDGAASTRTAAACFTACLSL